MTLPIYLAEIAPSKFRGRVVASLVVLITGGQVLAYIVGAAFFHVTKGWRWMFGLGAVPAGIQLLLSFSLPESPRYHVRKGRLVTATETIQRLNPSFTNEAVQRRLLSLQKEVRMQDPIVNREGDPRQLLSSAIKKTRSWRLSQLKEGKLGRMWEDRANRRALLVACGLQFFQQVRHLHLDVRSSRADYRDPGHGIQYAHVLVRQSLDVESVGKVTLTKRSSGQRRQDHSSNRTRTARRVRHLCRRLKLRLDHRRIAADRPRRTQGAPAANASWHDRRHGPPLVRLHFHPPCSGQGRRCRDRASAVALGLDCRLCDVHILRLVRARARKRCLGRPVRGMYAYSDRRVPTDQLTSYSETALLPRADRSLIRSCAHSETASPPRSIGLRTSSSRRPFCTSRTVR